MATNTSTVVGVFNDYTAADRAARAIIESGIPRESVQVQSSNRTATAGSSTYDTHEREGGISGFFHRLFGEDDESKQYTQQVEKGRAVVVVDTSDTDADRAVELLNEHGAVDIEDGENTDDRERVNAGTTKNRDTAFTGHETSAMGAGVRNPSTRDAAGGSSIPVVDEEIRIGKRAIQRGGVRVYSHVVEQPVEETILLREEHIRVERRPVDRQISDAEIAGIRDQSFEVTETVEEPVIEKRARVKEEVVIGKETTEKTQKVSDTVRRTDVKVERFGDSEAGEAPVGNGRASQYDADFRDDWKRNYSSQGGDYMAYAPAYDYGYRYASDPKYKGRRWEEVESDLRAGYERDNPGGAWDRMKNAVRYGWEKVTGKR